MNPLVFLALMSAGASSLALIIGFATDRDWHWDVAGRTFVFTLMGLIFLFAAAKGCDNYNPDMDSLEFRAK